MLGFRLIDTFVELYLSSVIKPFLKLHEVFYSGLNKVLRKCLDDHKQKIPIWFTANFITYFRTILVIPTLLLLAWKHQILPAIIVIAVDFGDLLDGVVARYWVDVRNEQRMNKLLGVEQSSKDKKETNIKEGGGGTVSPTDSDEDSFGTYGDTSFSCILVRTVFLSHHAITFFFFVSHYKN